MTTARAAAPEVDVLRALLGRVAEGDRAAFKTLYESTSKRVLGVLVRLVRDRELAEDVAQETFVSIWRKAHLYKSDLAEPMTWIVSIARHRAIDEIRRRKELRPTPAEAEAEQACDPQALAGDEQIIAREGLSRCLDKLDPRHKRMIELAYVDGYSRDELAQRFDTSANTIKTWLRRGLGSLKACLETS